jgi:hypothetical protein
MSIAICDAFQSCLEGLKDPRSPRNQKHLFDEIIFAAFCAILCGANGWVDMESFAQGNLTFLRQYFSYAHGFPSDDTFCRTISTLDSTAFQRSFAMWMKEIVHNLNGQIIAINLLLKSVDFLDN